MSVTIKEYKQAIKIVEDYKFCGCDGESDFENSFGCCKMMKTEDAEQTTQYGQDYYWCPDCYQKIKND